MKDKIYCYSDLGPDERREVEEYVAAHPALQPELARARALAEVIDAARQADVDDEDLARFVTHGMGGGTSGLSDREYARISNRIEQDPELANRARHVRDRLRQLARDHDPIAHFDALTAEEALPATKRGSSVQPLENGRSEEHGFPLRHLPVRRLSIAAAMAFLMLSASFVVLQIATTSQLDRLATFRADETDRGFYEIRTRSGATPSATRADSLFLEALDLLRVAQRSYVGLFFSHDEGALRQAGQRLRTYLERQPEESFLTLEARYLLAKVLVRQGRLDEAAGELTIVVDEGGARTERARQLLGALPQRR